MLISIILLFYTIKMKTERVILLNPNDLQFVNHSDIIEVAKILNYICLD